MTKLAKRPLIKLQEHKREKADRDHLCNEGKARMTALHAQDGQRLTADSKGRRTEETPHAGWDHQRPQM